MGGFTQGCGDCQHKYPGFMLPFNKGRTPNREVVTGDVQNMKRLNSIKMLYLFTLYAKFRCGVNVLK